jgi:DNA polymerase III subunit epsilon
MTRSILSRLQTFFGNASDHPLLERNNVYFSRLDQNRPIDSFDFVVLDTELTGMNPEKDEIVSIGAVKIRELAINPSDVFHTLVHPRRAMPKKSTLIHRITPETVREAPRLHEILPHLIEYCEGCLIVGHHVGMDMSFINKALKEVLGGCCSRPASIPCAWPRSTTKSSG